MDNFYRLVNDKYPDIIFGVCADTDNEEINRLLDKLNNGLSKIKPWKQCVPMFKNCKFAFLNLNVLCTFLYKLCKFTVSDLITLAEDGWYIQCINLSVYGKGMSNIWVNYIDDEITDIKRTEITDYINCDYHIVSYKQLYDSNEIKRCYNMYYTDIKTYY